MDVPDSCPICATRQWVPKEYETTESFSENRPDSNEKVFIAKGTLVQQISCKDCGFVIRRYQNPHTSQTFKTHSD